MKTLKSIVTAALVGLGLVTASANAALVLSLETTSGGKTVSASAGNVVTLRVMATVTAGGAAEEGLQSAYFSLLSGGDLRGNFSNVQATSPFDGTSHQDVNSPTNPISPIDLDGDGDSDFGSNNNGATPGFVYTRANSMQIGNSFQIATVDWTVGNALAADDVATLNLRLRTGSAGAAWREDGSLRTTATSGGSAGTVQIADAVTVAVPEPAAVLAIVGLGAMGLLRRRARR